MKSIIISVYDTSGEHVPAVRADGTHLLIEQAVDEQGQSGGRSKSGSAVVKPLQPSGRGREQTSLFVCPGKMKYASAPGTGKTDSAKTKSHLRQDKRRAQSAHKRDGPFGGGQRWTLIWCPWLCRGAGAAYGGEGISGSGGDSSGKDSPS